MNNRLSVVTGLALAGALLLAACGGSSDSSRTKNTVIAGGPCIAVAPPDLEIQPNLVVSGVQKPHGRVIQSGITFCAGAVQYSKDNGETRFDVPNGVFRISEDMWPAATGNVSKVSIMSYDQAGMLIGDDVVTRTMKTNCASGSYCNPGDTGPNGGTVLQNSTGSLYFEIMKSGGESPSTGGESPSTDRVSRADAAYTMQTLGAPWQLPTVDALTDILPFAWKNNITDPRLSHFTYAPGESLACDMGQRQYCTFHPYWTIDNSANYAPSTLPMSEAGLVKRKTIGYDLWSVDNSVVQTEFCPIDADERSSECLATLLPLNVYKPEIPTIEVAVVQVDRERWQELCTDEPEIQVSDHQANKDFTITVNHPCIATASKTQSVDLVFKLMKYENGDYNTIVADTNNLSTDKQSVVHVEAPTNDGYTFTYNLPQGQYLIKSKILFERVGGLDSSNAVYTKFEVDNEPFRCSANDFFLNDNKLTTTCNGATGMYLSYVSGVDLSPRAPSEPAQEIAIDMPAGWHVFDIVTQGKNQTSGNQFWACLTECEAKPVKDLKLVAINEELVLVTSSRPACERLPTLVIGQTSVNGNSRFLSYGGPYEEVAPGKKIIIHNGSGVYMYRYVDCDEQGTDTAVGLVFVDANEPAEDVSASDKEDVARVEVMDLVENNDKPVVATALNTTMEVIIEDKNISMMAVTINGVVTTVSSGSQPALIKIPSNATSMSITTTKKNGAVETFTKAISRPTQLPTAAVAAPQVKDSSSNKMLPIILIVLVLLLIAALMLRKFRPSKESL